MKLRSEIEEKYKWNLSTYFSSEEEFEKSFAFVQDNYKKVCAFEGKLNNKKDIFDCLNLENEIGKIASIVYVYASLKAKEDSFNRENKVRLARVERLMLEMGEVTTFVSVELMELDDSFLLELSKDADFKDYDLMFLDIIKSKIHKLDKNQEILLTSMSDFSGQFSEIFDMFDSGDIAFEDILDSNGNKLPLNNSIYAKYIQSGDRVLRENAYKTMMNTYGKLNLTLCANYMGNVKADCFYSKIRGFKTPLEMSMFAEDVCTDVYKKLVSQIEGNLAITHEYFAKKQQKLGVDKIALFDMHAPIYNLKANYSFEESKLLCEKALAVLGDDYIQNFNLAFSERWIDVFASKGKDTGAFSWGAYGKNPVVMLNHEDTVRCVFTLAHEMGHALHTYYSNKNQVSQKAGYEIFVAEVASTVNEMLLVLHLIDNAKSQDEKLYYVDYLISMFISTVHRQTMFASFEDFAHNEYQNGGDTTADALNEFYLNLNKKYFGENVDVCEEVKVGWNMIPHFYSSFYVYKYATGLISAMFIATNIYEGNKDVLAGYKKFLTLGGSASPLELLKVAGVDLLSDELYKQTFEKLKSYIDMF